jgi:hypothetical protein
MPRTCSWPPAAAALLASRLSVSSSMSSGSVSGLVERTGLVTFGCSTACSFCTDSGCVRDVVALGCTAAARSTDEEAEGVLRAVHVTYYGDMPVTHGLLAHGTATCFAVYSNVQLQHLVLNPTDTTLSAPYLVCCDALAGPGHGRAAEHQCRDKPHMGVSCIDELVIL